MQNGARSSPLKAILGVGRSSSCSAIGNSLCKLLVVSEMARLWRLPYALRVVIAIPDILLATPDATGKDRPGIDRDILVRSLLPADVACPG